jgi:hypothetical protein
VNPTLALCTLFTLLSPLSIAGTPPSPPNTPQWNQFRGPNGSGTLPHSSAPLNLNPNQPTWSTPTPQGHSSPILWNQTLFLSAIENNQLLTLALNTTEGTILWQQATPQSPLEPVHKSTSPAASTPAANEHFICSYFASYGLLCFKHDGQLLWSIPLPTPKNMYGNATSPIIHHNHVILLLDDDTNLPDSQLSRSRIVAFNLNDGSIAWETPRPYNRSAWSTPMIWNHSNDQDLVALGNGRAYGYNPKTGQEKWYFNGFAREPIAIPVANTNLLFLSAARQGGGDDSSLDPEPFWNAMLLFDSNHDGQISTNEITPDFSIPIRPELPPGHPGFGLPLPDNPEKRWERQLDFFAWRDKNHDGIWTHDEFAGDMRMGSGKALLAAIKPGGNGDITETHSAWTLSRGIPDIPSPILHNNLLYLLRSGGLLTCINTTTGKTHYSERLKAPGQYTASPVITQNQLLLISENGTLTIVPTQPAFSITRQINLNTKITATPALDANTLYLRTPTHTLAFR